MKTISVVNLKGGVGKTVTAVNMAALLASEYGKRVLVIDCDPQANATQFFGIKGEDCNTTVLDILNGNVSVVDEYIYSTNIEGVDCVPSTIDLITADIASAKGGTSVESLNTFCNMLKDMYDYCIIDCPPSFTAGSVSAIAASNEIVIPVKIDSFAMSGLSELIRQIAGINSVKKFVSYHVLVTMWHNSPAVTQGEALLLDTDIPIFEHHIRRSDKVDESTYAKQPLQTYSKTSSAGIDYRAFVKEFLEGGELNA